MKNPLRFLRITALLTASLVGSLASAQYVWTPGSSDLLWSTPDNWSPAGPPGPTDDVQFLDTGAASDATTINNIVSADMMVQSVLVGPTNGSDANPEAFNTLINPGITLTVGGTDTATDTYHVGTMEYVDVLTTVTNTVSGPGATLVLDNTNNSLIVREGNASSGNHLAVMDMSGLDTFQANLGRVLVGVGDTSYRRAVGNLVLAKTNSITLWGDYPQLLVGDNRGNNNGNSSVSRLVLGQDNTFFADSVRVGSQKQQGNMSFSSTYPSSSLVMRGSDGVSRATEFGIGDESDQGGSGNPTTGRVDLGNGTVDILVDTVYVGRGQTGAGRDANGFLTLGAGTFDVNDLEVAYQNSANAAYPVRGTVTLNGTTTTINDLLRLGRSAGSDQPRNATLYMTGGSLDVVSNFVTDGTVDMGITNATVNLPAGSEIAANDLAVDGGTINNVTSLQVTNNLLVANGGTINGVQSYDLGTNGMAIWTLETSLTFSNSLSGAGTINGDVIQAKGATLNPGGTGVAGTLNIYSYYTPGNLTLNGGKLPLDLSDSAGFGSDSLLAFGNLTLLGTNDVPLNALNGSLDTTTPYTIISYYGTLTGDASYFQASGPLSKSRYTFAFGTSTPNAVTLTVGGSGAANLVWAGNGTDNNWDLINTADWLNGAAADKFYNLDSVTFDDSGSASPAVNLVGELLPGSITMNNSSKNYTFAGTGSLGSGGLTNYGTASLTISNDGTNSLTYVDVENGSVSFAGGSANTLSGGMNINFGASVNVANTNANDFGPIVNNYGSITFNQPVDAELPSAIVGTGDVTKNGDNVLTISGDNVGSYSGNLLVNAGTLRAGTAGLLSVGPNTIANGATLDVNGFNLGLSPVTVSGSGAGGEGAIVSNTGNPSFIGPNLAFVTLAGDTTFGGTGRWDLRSAGGSTGDPATAGLSTGGQPYNLTKVGTNGVYIVSVTMDPMLADIDVKSGTLSFEGTTTSMGDPAKTLTVESGATLQFYRTTNLWDKHFVLNGDGLVNTINNASGDNTMVGAITINGSCLFNAGGTYSLTNAGPIDGSGSLIKTGGSGSRVVLAVANTYTGATVVSNGTLEVNGSIAGSGVDVEDGTLAGAGSINTAVFVNTNGTFSPGGNGIVTMTVSGDLSLSGTMAMDVDNTGGVFSNDQVTGIANLTLGGTLELNLTGDALAAGNSITLFSATSGSGAFDSITPVTPGTGLQWDTSELASSGVLKVVEAGTTPPTIGTIIPSDGNVIISGTGGSPNGSYIVLTSTNLGLSLSSWTPASTNQFDSSGNFSVTNSQDHAQQYFILKLLP